MSEWTKKQIEAQLRYLELQGAKVDRFNQDQSIDWESKELEWLARQPLHKFMSAALKRMTCDTEGYEVNRAAVTKTSQSFLIQRVERRGDQLSWITEGAFIFFAGPDLNFASDPDMTPKAKAIFNAIIALFNEVQKHKKQRQSK